MTELQKNIIRKLLEGGGIVGSSKYGYRLRDAKHTVLIGFSQRTFFKINHLLRKHKDQFVINKSKVRQLHGSCFAKKLYKRMADKTNQCAPCVYESPGVSRKKIKKIVVQEERKSQLQFF